MKQIGQNPEERLHKLGHFGTAWTASSSTVLKELTQITGFKRYQLMTWVEMAGEIRATSLGRGTHWHWCSHNTSKIQEQETGWWFSIEPLGFCHECKPHSDRMCKALCRRWWPAVLYLPWVPNNKTELCALYEGFGPRIGRILVTEVSFYKNF